MKQFLSLTMVQLKMHMGIAELFSAFRGKAKDKLRGVGYLVLALVLCSALIFIVSALMNVMFRAAMIPALQQTVLAMMIMAAMLVVLLFGIFYAISLYYAKDNAFLMSLPIGKYKVFAAKFIVALIGEVGTFALILVPALIVFALHAEVSLSYFFTALIVVLMGPLIPFAIANILAALLMRVSVISRYKDKIAIIGGFILMAGYIFLNQYLSVNLASMNANDILVLLSGGLVRAVTAAFPPAQWAAMALVFKGGSALTGLVSFVGVSILAFGLCILVAGRIYMTNAATQSETMQKNRRVTMSRMGQTSRHPAISVFYKEWKVLLRSPIYAMNALITIILAPLMVAVMVFTPLQGADGGMEGFIAMMLQNDVGGLFLAIGAGYCYLMSSINVACMTMYSREGAAIWIPLAVPVRAKAFYDGKLLCSLSISLVSVLMTALAFMGFLRINAALAFGSALLGFLGCLPALILMLLLDMGWPRLHWDSERQAMKSNVNSMLGMLIGFIFGPLLFLAGFALVSAGLSLPQAILIVTALCALLAVAFYTLSARVSQQLLVKMAER